MTIDQVVQPLLQAVLPFLDRLRGVSQALFGQSAAALLGRLEQADQLEFVLELDERCIAI